MEPAKAPKTKPKIDEIIAKYDDAQGQLLGILEQVQKSNRYNYLPEDILEYIAAKTATPLSKIYSVVTFYSFFNLKPEGDHCITICRGTACHTKGSKNILDYLLGSLDFGEEKIDESVINLLGGW